MLLISFRVLRSFSSHMTMRKPQSEKIEMKKGPWSVEEDQKLIKYMHKHGRGKWNTITKNAGLQRCGKSCRLRWINYLRPDIKRGRFSAEEEDTIIHLHSVLGNKWSSIASHLPGRTDNEIKNYWNTHIRKRLLKQGIDPVNHTLCHDLIQLYSFLKIQNLFEVQNIAAGTTISNFPNLFPFSDASLFQSKLLEHHPGFLHDNQFNNSPVQYQYQPLIQASFNDFNMHANMESFSPNINFISENFAPCLSHSTSMISNQTAMNNCLGNNFISPWGMSADDDVNESPYFCQLPEYQSHNFQFTAQKVELGSVTSIQNTGV